MKKSVFSETAKAFISEKMILKKRTLQGAFPCLCAKSLHQHPRYAVLYSLAFLYGMTSMAVFWRLAWEIGVRHLKEVALAFSISSIVHVIWILFLAIFCLALSVVLLCLMKRISTAVCLWLFGEREEKSDNSRFRPLAAGICVSFLVAVGFRDISCVIGYYASVDLCVLPLAMVVVWLLVRLDFIQ